MSERDKVVHMHVDVDRDSLRTKKCRRCQVSKPKASIDMAMAMVP
jgi:hypothetical protein